MRKDKNKGFTLVELIIAIAIISILSIAIGLTVIRYIDKARKADDIAAADAVGVAFQAAMIDNEDIYEYVKLHISYIHENDSNQTYRILCYMNAGYQNYPFHFGNAGDPDLKAPADAALANAMTGLMGRSVFKLKFTATRTFDQWIVAADKIGNIYIFVGAGINDNVYFIGSNHIARNDHRNRVYMVWPQTDKDYMDLTRGEIKDWIRKGYSD